MQRDVFGLVICEATTICWGGGLAWCVLLHTDVIPGKPKIGDCVTLADVHSTMSMEVVRSSQGSSQGQAV